MKKNKKIRRDILREIDQSAKMPDRTKGFVSIDNMTIGDMIKRRRNKKKVQVAKALVESAE